MSTNVHETTCAQAREPQRRGNGLVRVSPTHEGAGAAPGRGGVTCEARRPRTAASGSPPSSHRIANQRHSNQNRGRRAPNAHRAEERCLADLLLGAPRVGVISKTSVRVRSRHMRPGETTLHTHSKKTSEDDGVRKTTRQHLGRGAKIASRRTDLLLDKIAVTEHPTRIARTTSARWTSLCMHLGLVPSRNKHAKMLPRELGSVDCRTARDMCVRRWRCVGSSPGEPPTRCQTQRPEDLPSGREPCHEKSKGTGATVG